MGEESLTYRDAGVDLEAAARLKDRLASVVASTRTAAVRADYGSFGGRFHVPAESDLVASADGVGTKLKVAQMAGRHDTVGEDLVNHCVNDILSEGGVPLIFLDYFACGKLEPDVTLEVLSGVARGCRRNHCALLGGETAEMPDFYKPGEYDLAGFVVGHVAFPDVARRTISAGDRLIALAADGFHTNGYTFLRRLLFDDLGLGVDDELPGFQASVADVLLRVHRSYLAVLRVPCERGEVLALAHVTGGGIPGNLSRVLPKGLDAVIRTSSWIPPQEFAFVAEASGASASEMYRVFNMGIGMIAVVEPDFEGSVIAAAESQACAAWRCGELCAGDGRVQMMES